MERLTMIDGMGNEELVRCMGCGLEKAGENLENCGFCEEGWQKALKKLYAIEDILGNDYGLDRLRELVEADREGRAVVLPCKPGDTINAFRLGKEKTLCVISDMVTSVTTNRYGWTVKTKSKFLPIKERDGNKIAPISQYLYALADYYVGPREAAEAALKGGHDVVH